MDRVRPAEIGGQLIRDLGPARLDVAEISAGQNQTWRKLGFRSYRSLDWPEFDICETPLHPDLNQQFDLVIADNVLEHTLWPYRATRNMHAMLRPGGHALVITPFLVRIHSGPHDCSRWTETGLKHLLAECGFALDAVQTWSWGTRAAVRKGLDAWPRMGWRRTLGNDPSFPFVVWAFARKDG